MINKQQIEKFFKEINTKEFLAGDNLLENLTKKNLERIPFKTISPQEELELLKRWSVPSELLYVWEAWKRLHQIDENHLHSYTQLVNDGLFQMFIQIWWDLNYYHQYLARCLAKTKEWIDIGTWNWLVTNNIALNLVSQINLKKAKDILDIFKDGNLDEIQKFFSTSQEETEEKPKFILCDFSPESLTIAEDYAKNKFFWLNKFFDLSYYEGKFQNLLADNNAEDDNPKLITMFNVLANFSQQSLKQIIKESYESMKEWDVLLPSFFLKTEEKSRNRDEYLRKTESLYNNPETRSWCLSSFAERYNIDPNDLNFHVNIKNDGREYISIDLTLPADTKISIPNTDNKPDIELKASEIFKEQDAKDNFRKINLFKSYRMTKDEIEEIFIEAWFQIDSRIDDYNNNLMTIPVVHK